MMKHFSHRHSLTLIALLVAACSGPDEPAGPTFTTRDSAGIIIAENQGEISPDVGGWSVSPEPILQIGAMDGDEAYLFSRISGAAKLSDGRIAVADNRAWNLRIFSATGEHLHTFGGRGEGPGEFNSPRLLGTLTGDTLVVVDSRLRRINLFHPEEGFIRSATASTEIPSILLTEGMFSSGSVMIQRMVFGEDRSGGYARQATHYRTVALDGTMERDWGEFAGEELILASQTEGQATMSLMGNAPFGKSPAVAIGGQHFFYGSQDSYEIQLRSQTGVLERIIRLAKEPAPVTGDQLTALLEEELQDLEDNDLARQYRRFYEDAPIPDFHPAYGSIYSDMLGYLWVEETRVSEDQPRLFSVFDPEGRLSGSLSLPTGLLIQEIGEDYILGRSTDELGIQYLHVHSLTRPS
jgi:hypothetical protein